MKKALALIMSMSLIVSLATGCGNSGQTIPSGNAPAAQPGNSTSETGDAAPVTSGSKGTLEFWTVFTGADGVNMQSIVDAYNAKNPDYTVHHRAVDANDLYLKMPLAIQSGQDVPDIAINHVERIRAFKDNDLLTELSSSLESAGISKDSYNEKAWSMTDLDGGHYGIPLDVHTYVLYANMDLYEQYGAGELDDGVLTWDEVKTVGERLKGTDIVPIGMAWLRAKFLASYAQLGGTLSSDGQTPDFNNPLSHQVLQNWIDLKDLGYTNKEGDQPWEMFLGGKTMFCPEGIWMNNNVKDTGLNAKMFDYVVFDPNVKGNWTSSHQFVLPRSSDRTEEETIAALKFIDYVGNNSLEWAKAGQTPAHMSITEVAEFNEMPQSFLASQNEELKIYDYKYYGYAVEALDKVLPEIWWGRMTIEAGLSQAVQEAKDRIETES